MSLTALPRVKVLFIERLQGFGEVLGIICFIGIDFVIEFIALDMLKDYYMRIWHLYIKAYNILLGFLMVMFTGNNF